MRGITLSPDLQQLMAVGVPIAALLISLGVVYPGYQRYVEMSAKVEKQRQELHKLKNTPLPPVSRALPAADPEPGESARFLGHLVSLATSANCRFVGLDSAPVRVAHSGGLIRAVRTRVEIEGRYPQIRQFLAELANASRIYVVTSLDIDTRGRTNQPGQAPSTVRAIVEIERYLTVEPETTNVAASR
ncbi:MAG TPA: GspMb/PilO family protein [Armatimonadota bacterium]|jgi:Tfp pilus assembly protein PilO|nr:GspMb/PilO family protein [Armatimonadota bacterium]HOM83091.1 GspMb/PilO family protein [Armatimonadota bacterium]HOQ27196.1 GspMb/PilO family protein [Armatimonadota bacterium]HPO72935.1 GspMb/PilO family protein [Armatimonadota bacterium]HPT97751.1 GspMb/PilO family protein [Armatimonadota bacterium]